MKIVILTQEEERALIARAHLGDIGARNELVERNRPFAIKRARRYYRALVGKAEMEDLIQVAYEGLIEAVERFDLAKTVRFVSYANYWIDHHLRDYRNRNIHLVTIPRNLVQVLVAEQMGRTGGVRAVEWGDATIQQAREVMATPLRSLGRNRPGVDGVVLDVPDPREPGAEAIEILEDAAALLALLPCPRDRRVLVMRFGLDGNDPRSFPDIAAELGICRTTAKQALVRLRRAATGRDHLPGGLKMRREYFRPKVVRA